MLMKKFIKLSAIMILSFILLINFCGNNIVSKKLCSSFINRKNEYGWTSIHYAVGDKNFPLIKFLIFMGADVNIRGGQYGSTPLIMAVDQNNLQLTRLLLDAGADTSIPDGRFCGASDCTVLYSAIFDDKIEILKLLISIDKSILKPPENQFLLHRACKTRQVEAAKILIANGCDVNQADTAGDTPLHYSADCFSDCVYDREGRLAEIVKQLIEAGADVNRKNKIGETPLHIAVWKGRIDMIDILTSNKTDINSREKYGKTPLHFLALTSYINPIYPEELETSIANLLCKNGAIIDAKDSGGETPLHIASWNGKTRIVEFLINNGADVNARDCLGRAPLHYVSDDFRPGFRSEKEMWKALGWESEKLVKSKELVNKEDLTGNIQLRYSFEVYRANDPYTIETLVKTAKCLIKNGALINIKDYNGETPLDIARKYGNTELVKVFSGNSVKKIGSCP